MTAPVVTPTPLRIPFFRPAIGEAEIAEVVDTLRSGWLTTGPKAHTFETEFAAAVGSAHAIAVNSCTAALHIALEALGLHRGDLVLVPTMTFAATAEVVRYFDAVPVLVDCEPRTLTMDPAAARATLDAIARGEPVAGLRPPYGPVRGLIPVHYGGQMADVFTLGELARERGLFLVEDAAHTMPARARASAGAPWVHAGTVGKVGCFSFYANKCITTGEGGMATTDDPEVATRMRVMSLHGLSKDAWKRFSAQGSWYYEIVAPGFKYNMTDVAAALGLVQLRRAGELWQARRHLAARYAEALARVPGVELPVEIADRESSWHLYPVRLDPGVFQMGRSAVIGALAGRGIGCSVHWMPLHLHPYYRQTYGTGPGLFPVAEAAWERLVSLPFFPGMTDEEVETVAGELAALATR